MLRHLWLIRHAKSDWSTGQSDFERPLNPRGLRDGPNMQAWLAEQPHPADWIWCSAAVRTRQTCDFVSAAFDVTQDAIVDTQALYHATPEAAMDVIRSTPESAQNVAVIFHNPGITHLLHSMSSEAPDNVPTFGTARLSTESAWHDCTPLSFTLEVFTSPKRL